MIKNVLLVNGIADLLVAIVLIFFTYFGFPIPGYSNLDLVTIFVAGGWGIAALTLGITRIWASQMEEFYIIVGVCGLIEGFSLAVFSFIYLAIDRISYLQAILPLGIGVIFGIAYLVSLILLVRKNKKN